jgi:hypothetical protein
VTQLKNQNWKRLGKLGKTGTKVQFCSSFVKGLQRSNRRKTGTKLDFTQFCQVQPLPGDCHQICRITTKTKLALVSHFCFQFCSSFLYCEAPIDMTNRTWKTHRNGIQSNIAYALGSHGGKPKKQVTLLVNENGELVDCQENHWHCEWCICRENTTYHKF